MVEIGNNLGKNGSAAHFAPVVAKMLTLTKSAIQCYNSTLFVLINRRSCGTKCPAGTVG